MYSLGITVTATPADFASCSEGLPLGGQTSPAVDGAGTGQGLRMHCEPSMNQQRYGPEGRKTSMGVWGGWGAGVASSFLFRVVWKVLIFGGLGTGESRLTANCARWRPDREDLTFASSVEWMKGDDRQQDAIQ
jgi:hypothetical protein